MIAGMLNDYVGVFISVFIVNIIPAFAPPTWLVLAYAKLKHPYFNELSLLLVGLAGAVLGRLVMYHYSSLFSKLVVKGAHREALEFVEELAKKNKRGVFVASFLYSLSPLSSNIMFIFSGASRIPRLPLFAGFALGRFISYGLALFVYVRGIEVAENMLSLNLSNWVDGITLILAIAMMFVDWKKIYKKVKDEAKPSSQTSGEAS